MEFKPQDLAAPSNIPCARSLMEWDWATHLDYYKLCRDSCHNLAQKFLSLLFQLSTFAIGSLTLAGYVREKVRVDTAAAIAVIAATGTFYFALMLWRYYRIVGELSELCWRMESRMFPKEEVQVWGIFHVIDSRSSFYASKWVRRLIIGYCITLMAAHIVFLTTIWIEWLTTAQSHPTPVTLRQAPTPTPSVATKVSLPPTPVVPASTPIPKATP